MITTIVLHRLSMCVITVQSVNLWWEREEEEEEEDEDGGGEQEEEEKNEEKNETEIENAERQKESERK